MDHLDDVEVPLSNVDADRVAITADHGDALGYVGWIGSRFEQYPPILR